jgi:hypothetical protein
MWFSLGVNYLTQGGKAIKLRGGLIQTGTGKKARPIRKPCSLIRHCSLVKRRRTANPTKIMEPSILTGKPEDWMMSTVRV